MTTLAEALALAIEHHQAGRLAEAEAVCRRILVDVPGDSGALHVLGVVAMNTGRNELAVECLEQALRASPSAAEVHNSLAEAFRGQGQLERALSHYRRALELNPALAEAHCNLASATLQQGKAEEAITGYRTALSLQPGLVDARCRLAFALRASGSALEGIQLLFEGAIRQPANVALRRALSEMLRGVGLSTAGEGERAVIASLCADDDVSMMYLSSAVIGLLRHSPALSRPAEFARDALLLAALPRMVMHDVEVELALTGMRRSILLGVLEGGKQSGAGSGFAPGFGCALARQCFLAGYALHAAVDEARALKQVESRVQAALKKPIAEPRALEPLLVAAALYGPLSRFGGWELLLGPMTTGWSAPFRPILAEQLLNRRREKELEADLPALTPISDKVSKAVRQQYEDNPYPRWVSISRPQPMTLEEFARPLPNSNAAPPFPSPAQILVAGCGTGHHPLEVARKFRDCEILAIDLSRASLAYAARMAELLQVENIAFGQADILELGSLGRRFSAIECGGVLHHLRDPLQGWRVLAGLLQPGGLMKIALYSKSARRKLEAARAFVRAGRFEPTPEGIRRCRRAIIERPAGDPVRDATRFGDFFSLNGCRDLLMHVQEQVMTLPQIGGYLDELGLAFIAMEIDAESQARFSKLRDQAGAQGDLALWDQLEQADPDLFRNMYQFWCRPAQKSKKPDPTSGIGLSR